VEGTWKLGDSQLTIEQKYQTFTGKLTTGNVIAPITDGKLDGSRIAFTAAGSTYTGQVSGDAMEGTQGGSGGKWQATRAK
jgi:hypothetical protein